MRSSETRRSESGQIVVAFVVLIPVFILALFIVLDLGRYQIMRNQIRIAADSAALAAAGSLDIREAARGNFVLNESWAQQRASEAVAAMQGRITEDAWMTISLTSVRVDGSEVEVGVNGTARTIFGSFPLIGISGFNASVLSRARSATGVNTEW
jgi:Flp pilus assembly protein TadG